MCILIRVVDRFSGNSWNYESENREMSTPRETRISGHINEYMHINTYWCLAIIMIELKLKLPVNVLS